MGEEREGRRAQSSITRTPVWRPVAFCSARQVPLSWPFMSAPRTLVGRRSGDMTIEDLAVSEASRKCRAGHDARLGGGGFVVYVALSSHATFAMASSVGNKAEPSISAAVQSQSRWCGEKFENDRNEQSAFRASCFIVAASGWGSVLHFLATVVDRLLNQVRVDRCRSVTNQVRDHPTVSWHRDVELAQQQAQSGWPATGNAWRSRAQQVEPGRAITASGRSGLIQLMSRFRPSFPGGPGPAVHELRPHARRDMAEKRRGVISSKIGKVLPGPADEAGVSKLLGPTGSIQTRLRMMRGSAAASSSMSGLQPKRRQREPPPRRRFSRHETAGPGCCWNLAAKAQLVQLDGLTEC